MTTNVGLHVPDLHSVGNPGENEFGIYDTLKESHSARSTARNATTLMDGNHRKRTNSHEYLEDNFRNLKTKSKLTNVFPVRSMLTEYRPRDHIAAMKNPHIPTPPGQQSFHQHSPKK